LFAAPLHPRDPSAALSSIVACLTKRERPLGHRGLSLQTIAAPTSLHTKTCRPIEPPCRKKYSSPRPGLCPFPLQTDSPPPILLSPGRERAARRPRTRSPRPQACRIQCPVSRMPARPLRLYRVGQNIGQEPPGVGLSLRRSVLSHPLATVLSLRRVRRQNATLTANEVDSAPEST